MRQLSLTENSVSVSFMRKKGSKEIMYSWPTITREITIQRIRLIFLIRLACISDSSFCAYNNKKIIHATPDIVKVNRENKLIFDRWQLTEGSHGAE